MGSVSRQDLHALWPLIWALHPSRPVAECVLLDVGDTLACLAHTQAHRENKRERRGSPGYYRLALTWREGLQAAAYLASEAWEWDQEQVKPARQPGYHPTAEDRLVRYVKTLVWWALERPAPYAATALGCSLYTYPPLAVGELVPWAAGNIRRTHKATLGRLTARFPVLPLAVTRGHHHVALRPPTPAEGALVAQALTGLAPWSSHLPLHPEASLWGRYFAAPAATERAARAQVHALLDPQCAGIAQLIRDYNHALGVTSTMRLDPPDPKLGVPFPPAPDATDPPAGGTARFEPPALGDDDLARLEYTLARRQARRQQLRSAHLALALDGREVWRGTQDELHTHEVVVPAHASYLQVYGYDAQEPDAPLLLAVVPLPTADLARAAGAQPLTVPLVTGQTLAGHLELFPSASDEPEQYRLRLTAEAVPVATRAPSRPWRALLTTWGAWWRAWWRPQGAPAWRLALAVGLLLSLGLNGWLLTAGQGPGGGSPPQLGQRTAPPTDARQQALYTLAALDPAQRCQTYRFQLGLAASAPLKAWMAARPVPPVVPPAVGFTPQATPMTVVRLGQFFAEALVTLQAGQRDTTALRLDVMLQTLVLGHAPAALVQYLSAVQTLVQTSGLPPETVTPLLALVEPVYADAYASTPGAEPRLFQVGTWITNTRLATVAGDLPALLQQGQTISEVVQTLTTLQAPADVLEALTRLQPLLQRPTLAAADLGQITPLVQRLQAWLEP